MQAGTDVLVLLLDLNPFSWGRSQGMGANASLSEGVTQLLSFINMFKLLHPQSELCIGVAVPGKAEYVIPSENQNIRDGPRKISSGAEVKERIQEFFSELPKVVEAGEMGRHTQLIRLIVRAICLISSWRQKYAGEMEMKARILVVSVSEDDPRSYVAMMNCIFSAQSENIVVDVIAVGPDADSAIYQQAAYFTGGIYVRVAEAGDLLTTMLQHFVHDPSIRGQIQFVPSSSVDLQATCLCHRRKINIGYVCSRCLSVYCESRRKCTTCSGEFVEDSIEE